MTMMPSIGALAIPHLSAAIPLKYRLTGQAGLTAPLAIALIEADVISEAMLRHPRVAGGQTLAEIFDQDDARDLAMRALSKWWTNLIKANSCKFFRWNLHVQSLDGADIGPGYENTAWFIFTRMDGDFPRFAIGKNFMQLEATLEGFGQTVLAVLKDATLLLPDALTPWAAEYFAQYLHWSESNTDEELLEDRREFNGYATVQEVIENDDVMTRARFYEHMPRWATKPLRVATRESIVAAARTASERATIDACDAIAALVRQPTFNLKPHERGAGRCGRDSTDGSMVLLWQDGDLVGAVIDDYINDLFNSGDATDFIDANPVPMTAAGIREFQDKTEQMMQLAVLTERLVLLIGERL